jgi:hypothetical protein
MTYCASTRLADERAHRCPDEGTGKRHGINLETPSLASINGWSIARKHRAGIFSGKMWQFDLVRFDGYRRRQ